MPDITVIDLSDVELHDENSSGQSEEQLEQEYDLGQPVEVPDGEGVIAEFMEESFEFPVGQSEGQIEEVEDDEEPEMDEIEASSDNPVYIVALLDGGAVVVSPDEIEEIEGLEGEGEDIESPDEAKEIAGAELSELYKNVKSATDSDSFEQAKISYIHQNYASELGEYVENNNANLETLEQLSSEELVNIKGVDDPHIGFNRLPDGWTRKSVIQGWISLGGTWRTAYARLIPAVGPRFAKRLASAWKDEFYRTEMWRGKF